jgi:hypothetical protein
VLAEVGPERTRVIVRTRIPRMFVISRSDPAFQETKDSLMWRQSVAAACRSRNSIMRFRRCTQSRLLVRNGIGQVSYRGTICRSLEDCDLIVIFRIYPCGKWHRSDRETFARFVVSVPISEVLYRALQPIPSKVWYPLIPGRGPPGVLSRYHTMKSQSVIRSEDGTVAGPLLINFNPNPVCGLTATSPDLGCYQNVKSKEQESLKLTKRFRSLKSSPCFIPRFDVVDEDQISPRSSRGLRRVVLRCAPCKHVQRARIACQTCTRTA